MGKYDIKKHTRRLFPWFWANATNMSLIDTSLTVFDNVNDELDVKETDYRQRVGYSIQRLSLESSLNDRFDSTLRRIVVNNSTGTGGGFVFNEAETIDTSLELFVFNEGESIPALANEAYIFNEGESQGSALSPFTVICPISIQGQESQIIAWIEAVQITGTEYELLFI